MSEPAPPSPPLPAGLGRLFEPVYRAAIDRRNRRFDAGHGVVRLEVPVISIGNLSVGGTGKSPMVMHVVTTLVQAGERPCIAMRGYSKGRRAPSSTHTPDETDAYQRHFPSVPTVAQPDRVAGLQALFSTTQAGRRPTCVVLDDGFQHRRIARDLDIVLIDASRSPFVDRLLPAGWQREPVESLRRASLVVLTHAEMFDAPLLRALDAQIASIRDGKGADAVTRHAWTGLCISPPDDRLAPLDWLLGKRVVAGCAIGNPEGFLHSLRVTLSADSRRAGQLVGALVLPDHDPYHPETVRALLRLADKSKADAIVVTDKDWSKLRHEPQGTWGDRPVVRPQLSLAFDRGGPEFDQAILDVSRLMP